MITIVLILIGIGAVASLLSIVAEEGGLPRRLQYPMTTVSVICSAIIVFILIAQAVTT